MFTCLQKTNKEQWVPPSHTTRKRVRTKHASELIKKKPLQTSVYINYVTNKLGINYKKRSIKSKSKIMLVQLLQAVYRDLQSKEYIIVLFRSRILLCHGH